MRIAVGTDEITTVTEAVERHLTAAGHEVVEVANGKVWPDVGRDVGTAVVKGAADRGLVWCWTGTGVSIAADKVPGVSRGMVHRRRDGPWALGDGTTPTCWPSASV